MAEIAYEAAVSKIGAIWADILSVPSVSPTDNFFGLGGDSIMVSIMALQVEHALDVMVPLDMVFDTQDLGEFTKAVLAAEPI